MWPLLRLPSDIYSRVHLMDLAQQPQLFVFERFFMRADDGDDTLRDMKKCICTSEHEDNKFL